MTKAYITGMLFQTSIQLIDSAQKAHEDGHIDIEVRCSLGAHVMCAFSLESIINEIGENVLKENWIWEKFEGINTSLKWWVISQFLEGDAFAPHAEPLNTVDDLRRKRNRLAHPKAIELGNELIVRNKDGHVRRDVPQEYRLMDGDTVFEGFGKLLVEFNASSARQAAIRTNSAFRALKDKCPGEPIKWVTEFESHYPWLSGS